MVELGLKSLDVDICQVPPGLVQFLTALAMLGGELPTARKWVITPVIYMG